MVHRGNWKSNFYRAGVIQRADQLILKVLSFLPLAEGGPGFLRHRSAPGCRRSSVLCKGMSIRECLSNRRILPAIKEKSYVIFPVNRVSGFALAISREIDDG